MTPVTLLAACIALTWLSRAAMVVLVPSAALPERVRRALPVAAPAALAALVSTDLVGAATSAASGSAAAGLGFAAAALAAGLMAFRTRSMLLAVLAGISVAAATATGLSAWGLLMISG